MASVLIALLVIVLLMLVLALIMVAGIFKEETVLVSYSAPVTLEDTVEKKVFAQARSKPSSPSSAMAKVIAANTTSPTAIPVPDVVVTEPSLTFGTGDDFGDGWGNGSGDGMGGGGTTFFRQKVKAQRVAYVIDYSKSMGGERNKLMRAELAKSVSQVGVGMQFQLIFFAGPTWVAGCEVAISKDKKTGTVKEGKNTFKWKGSGGAHAWSPAGKKQKPTWISAAPGPRSVALELVKTTPLVWGTNWENPLEMAIAMDPPPQVIFFMTDGVVGGDMVKLAEKLGHRAKTKGIVVNTVAMMEPKAEKAMKELAKRTGGQFTIVEKGGKVRVVPVD